jgi:uncharacterized protein
MGARMTENIVEYFNKELELIVMPTEDCIFRCDYCYEHFDIGRMKPETVSAMKKLIYSRINEIDHLTVQWFGGEPLMAYDIMVDTMKYIQELRNSMSPAPSLRSNVTTNGYLLDQKKLIELVGFGVNAFQISLDGDKEEHDKLRKMIDGEGTFDVIWSNLLRAHDTDLDFTITQRLHVNKDNEESMKSLLRRTAKEMNGDKRFEMFIRLLSRLGGPKDAALPITDDVNVVERLKEYAQTQGLRLAAFDPYGTMDSMCYAAKPYAFIIRADASISKCTVAFYDDFNAVGKLNPDGTMSVNNDLVSKWSKGLFSGNKEELGCPLKGFHEEKIKMVAK